ncbi:HNH endonuclease [Anaeromicrobium sediminis]|nr:HNH endonuclease [Anaeromicrobium sediminis]
MIVKTIDRVLITEKTQVAKGGNKYKEANEYIYIFSNDGQHYAIIDKAVKNEILSHKWTYDRSKKLFVNNSKVLKKKMYLHQMVLYYSYGEEDYLRLYGDRTKSKDPTLKMVIDHIDNDMKNNTIENLQIISHYHNTQKKRKKCTSDSVIISWKKREGVYMLVFDFIDKQCDIFYYEDYDGFINAYQSMKPKSSKDDVIEYIKKIEESKNYIRFETVLYDRHPQMLENINLKNYNIFQTKDGYILQFKK